MFNYLKYSWQGDNAVNEVFVMKIIKKSNAKVYRKDHN